MDLKAQILAELDANLQKLGESFGQYMDHLVSDRTITLGEAKDDEYEDMDDEDMDDEDMDDEDMDDEDMDDEDEDVKESKSKKSK